MDRPARWSSSVARTVLQALDRSGPAVVDGRRNAMVTAVLRFLPVRVVTGLALRLLAR